MALTMEQAMDEVDRGLAALALTGVEWEALLYEAGVHAARDREFREAFRARVAGDLERSERAAWRVAVWVQRRVAGGRSEPRWPADLVMVELGHRVAAIRAARATGS